MTTTKAITKKGILLDVASPTADEERMFEFLNSRVIGQPEACHAGVRIVTRSMSRLRTTGCAGFYALQGEPGVGKTELVKRICEYVHGDANAFVLIDGGLLQNDHQVNALVGAPPGYTGYEEPGNAAKRRAAEKELLKKLKEENPELAAKYKTFNPRKLLTRENLVASRGNSKSKLIIVFIDEIDKANVRVDDLLLNAIVNGILPLADNEMVDVSDVVFIIGGNHGSANVVERKAPPGFALYTEDKRSDDDRELIRQAMRDRHRPEFLDRLNEIIFFNKLSREDLLKITRLRLDEVVARYQQVMPRGTAFTVQVEDSARDFIFGHAMEEKGNARRIGRMVQKYFTDHFDRMLTKVQLNELPITVDDLVKVEYLGEGDALLFYLFEDEGEVAVGEDMVMDRGETSVTELFLGRERKRATLKLKAKGDEKVIYKVYFAADSEREMLVHYKQFVREVREILELPIVSFEMAACAPWALTLYIECTVDQSKMLEDQFIPEGVVSKTDRKSASK